MEKSWLYKTIFGDDPPPPPPPLAKIPFVDDDPSRHTPYQPDERAKKLFRRMENAAMLKQIIGDVDLTPLDNRSYESATPATDRQTPHMPKPTDPHQRCECGCDQCKNGWCGQCSADSQCEFAYLAPFGELLDIDAQTSAELHQAAATKQSGRLRKAKVARHRDGMKSLVDTFKADLRPLSNRVSPLLFENLLDSMAAYVADAQAAGWR